MHLKKSFSAQGQDVFSIYHKIQSAGLTNQYIEDPNFALQIKMLASLSFVPEDKVIQSFTD